MAPPRPRRHAALTHTQPEENDVSYLDLWDSMNAEGQAKTIRGLLEEGALSRRQIEGLAHGIPEIMDMALSDGKPENPLIKVGNFARELMGDSPPPDGTEPPPDFDPGPGLFGLDQEAFDQILRGEVPSPRRPAPPPAQTRPGEGILRVPPQQGPRPDPNFNPGIPANNASGQPPVNRARATGNASEPFAILQSFIDRNGLVRPLGYASQSGAQPDGGLIGQKMAANKRTPVHGGGGTGAGGYQSLGGSGGRGGGGGGGAAGKGGASSHNKGNSSGGPNQKADKGQPSKNSKKKKRQGEFTKSKKKKILEDNRDSNKGNLTCQDCNRDDLVSGVASRKGQKTPENQAQVHHDPPIKDGGGRASKGIVLCPKCHKERHKR